MKETLIQAKGRPKPSTGRQKGARCKCTRKKFLGVTSGEIHTYTTKSEEPGKSIKEVSTFMNLPLIIG